MSRTQVNFRIDEDLLDRIREEADREGIPYTAWIVKQCQIGLGLRSRSESQSESGLSHEAVKQLIDDTIQEQLNEALLKLKEELEPRLAANHEIATYRGKLIAWALWFLLSKKRIARSGKK